MELTNERIQAWRKALTAEKEHSPASVIRESARELHALCDLALSASEARRLLGEAQKERDKYKDLADAAIRVSQSDEKDAKRYRWLRRTDTPMTVQRKSGGKIGMGGYLDAAIDAFLSHGQKS